MLNYAVRTVRAGVSVGVAVAMLLSGIAPGAAAPMPVAGAQGAVLALDGASGLETVQYRRQRIVRRHHDSGINGGAVALGILGLGVAAIIAANGQNRRRAYYNEPAYEPQYRPAYEPQYEPDYYQQPAYAPPVVYAQPDEVYQEPWHQRRHNRPQYNEHAGRDDMYFNQRRHRARDNYAPQPPQVFYQQPAQQYDHYDRRWQRQNYQEQQGAPLLDPTINCGAGRDCGPRHLSQ